MAPAAEAPAHWPATRSMGYTRQDLESNAGEGKDNKLMPTVRQPSPSVHENLEPLFSSARDSGYPRVVYNMDGYNSHLSWRERDSNPAPVLSGKELSWRNKCSLDPRQNSPHRPLHSSRTVSSTSSSQWNTAKRRHSIPSYVRNRVSEMKSMISENDVEVRLDSAHPEGSRHTVIWVRRKNTSHPSADVQAALNALKCQPEVKLEHKRKFPVVIMRSGGKKFRALLESHGVTDDGYVIYRDIDSGMSCSVTANSVLRCSPELLAIPPNAWRCQLETSEVPKHLSPKRWTAMRIRVLKWSAVPTIRLVSKSDSDNEGDTHEDYSHIFDFERSVEHRTPSPVKSECVQRLYDELPGVPLPRGPLALLRDCWVVSVEWPYVYFVQSNVQENAQPLDPSFANGYSLDGFSVLDPKPGSLCMVRIGKRFWRAAVRRVKGDYVSVVFVDNGKQSVLSVGDILPLVPNQRYAQPACVKGRLPDNYLKKCVDEATLTLLAMAAGPLQVLLTKFDGDIPMVRLFGAAGGEICMD